MNRSFLAAVILALVAGPSSALAQTAKQGDPSLVVNPNAFHSPMVLETAFPAWNGTLWTNELFFPSEWPELEKFSCDGVNLGPGDAGLRMKLRKLNGGELEITLVVSVVNPKNNHDKMVDLLFEVLNGTEPRTPKHLRIKARDSGRASRESLTWTVPTVSLQKTTKLRITMSTEDY